MIELVCRRIHPPNAKQPPQDDTMNTKMKNFNEYDAYHAISKETGMRCRTCSRVYSAHPSDIVSFCPKHDTSQPHHPDYYEVEAVLGKICCDLQDQFFEELARSERPTSRWALLEIGSPFSFRSQRWWWTAFCIAHERCEESLEVLSHSLQNLLQRQRALCR